MVDKLTIFELRVDNPKIGGHEEAAAVDVLENEYEGVSDGDSGGRRRPPIGRLVLASVLLSIGATALVRRLRDGDEKHEIEIEGPDEQAPIEVEP